VSVRRLGSTAALAIALLALAAGGAAAAQLERLMTSRLARAGGTWGAYVLDTTTGRTLAAVHADVPRIPASVEKLYTTSTALLRLGPAATLATSVLGTGSLDASGTWQGDLYLRGGGDPTFGSTAFVHRAYGAGATVPNLAASLELAGIRAVSGNVYGDESRFDLLRGDPASGFALDRDIGGPLGALDYNRGLAREDGGKPQAHPATFAAQRLVAQLKRDGVRVAGRSGERATPVDARELARAPSPPLATLVALTLLPSDNFFAEMLLKDLGAAFGTVGSTSVGAGVVRGTIARFGIHPRILDGSGLSRLDRTSPRQVVALLNGMRADAALRAALPIAGRSGTLAKRLRRTAAQDRCQAKTGTLSNVSSLAGYCRAGNGHLIAFALLENHVLPARAHVAQDRITVALARLRPGSVPAPPPTQGGGAGTS
jgi:D-alanyl-D-alanine carboxypeptidase/D-alanyl-D-alanine-endopeptidase (penicillin-binding protein 4)